MSDRLDLTRIEQLDTVPGGQLVGVLRSLLESMTGAIEQLDSALVRRDLPSATQAAHQCRNDALMVGASELQRALSALEEATRYERLDDALAALERVREAWPPTRSALIHAAEARELR